MRRTAFMLAAGSLLAMPLASAATRQSTVGNYYFQDDRTRDRTKIVVDEGDQITFTVRQAAYPPHTVDVDELDIHSPDLLVGQTYTTPPLDRPGTYRLYCRPHEVRGHHTRLIVRAAPAATAKPVSTTTPLRTTPPDASPAVVGRPAPSATRPPNPSPTPTLAPVGVGTARPGALEEPLPVDPDSVEALTGVTRSNRYPWTRAVWWLLISAVPIIGAAAFALRRNSVLAAAHAPAAEAEPAVQRKPAARKRKPPAR